MITSFWLTSIPRCSAPSQARSLYCINDLEAQLTPEMTLPPGRTDQLIVGWVRRSNNGRHPLFDVSIWSTSHSNVMISSFGPYSPEYFMFREN